MHTRINVLTSFKKSTVTNYGFQCLAKYAHTISHKKENYFEKSPLLIVKNLIKIYTSMNTQIKRNSSEHYKIYAL